MFDPQTSHQPAFAIRHLLLGPPRRLLDRVALLCRVYASLMGVFEEADGEAARRSGAGAARAHFGRRALLPIDRLIAPR
jgi:hypothetical protein